MTRRASIAAFLHDLDALSPAGFAIALHIRFTTPTFMFQTYAKRWLDHYTGTGLIMHDPVVRWGMQNAGAIRWSELENLMDDGGVMSAARDFGLMNGAAIAVVEGGSRSVGGFARADREYEDAELAEMESLLAGLHRLTIGMPELSESDREALKKLSDRLTHL